MKEPLELQPNKDHEPVRRESRKFALSISQCPRCSRESVFEVLLPCRLKPWLWRLPLSRNLISQRESLFNRSFAVPPQSTLSCSLQAATEPRLSPSKFFRFEFRAPPRPK